MIFGTVNDIFLYDRNINPHNIHFMGATVDITHKVQHETRRNYDDPEF